MVDDEEFIFLSISGNYVVGGALTVKEPQPELRDFLMPRDRRAKIVPPQSDRRLFCTYCLEHSEIYIFRCDLHRE